MVWTLALWFLFVASRSSLFVNGEENLEGFPFHINEQDYSEQSPVDISTVNAERISLPFLRSFGYWAFDRAMMNITNNRHTVEVKLTEDTKDVPFIRGGPLFDKTYVFEQMHFHWGPDDCGSEHEVNGQKYAMEVHMVHYKEEYKSFKNAQNYIDGVCVIGLFGQISQSDNPEMRPFIADLKHLTEPGSFIVRSFKEEFSWIKQTYFKQRYYTYHGSLTTTPFTECVIWIVYTKPIDVSRKQLTSFRKLRSKEHGMLINENDRELQPFNNREIVYAH